jgi:hypothetical protein
MQSLPAPRGPVTEQLMAALQDPPGMLGVIEPPHIDEPLTDDDLQLALYLCYELHYRGLPGVDDGWEWDPSLLALRQELETVFERGLLDVVPPPDGPVPATDIDLALRAISEEDGPSLSSYIKVSASLEQLREFLVHRSAYQLKEADPHSWAIPRLTSAAKAALVEIQADEYGGGRPERVHAVLFANTMRGLGLDWRYGTYLAWLPGITLATVNLMSYLGLHRRLRGAVAGHLAAFEMTSSIPNRRYGNGIRRLGLGSEVTGFYDEHVEADAVHENIAAWDLAHTLAVAEPELEPDILFGARALLALEALWAEHLLNCWKAGRTSLTRPLDHGSRM